MLNALLIDPKDNVVVVLETIAAGTVLNYMDGETMSSITSVQDVPIFHKVARSPIATGCAVSKYGEHIGLAGSDIAVGQHVHTHNIESHREQLV